MRVKNGASCRGWSPGLSVKKISYRAQTTKNTKCKHTVQIATFNVRTLNRIEQLQELTASAIDHKIDIICIQEHRYTHSEDIKYRDTGNGWTVATASVWKKTLSMPHTPCMLIGAQALKTLNCMEKIHPRMLVATFNGNPRNGQHLTDFMIENRLTCLNKKNSKKGGEILDLHIHKQY